MLSSKNPPYATILTLLTLIVAAAALIYWFHESSKIRQTEAASTTLMALAYATPKPTPPTLNDLSLVTGRLRNYTISSESCRNLKDEEELDCFAQLALKEGDISLCDKFEGIGRDICVRQYALDYPETCWLLPSGSVRETGCFFYVAFAKNNISYCDWVEDASPLYGQSACKLNFLVMKAVFNQVTQDPGLCSAIRENDMRAYCMASMSQNSSACSRIPDDSWSSPWLKGKCVKCAGQRDGRCGAGVEYDYWNNTMVTDYG